MPLPNFFVIGAQKAGTSSVYQYLRQHPDIYMSPVKEPEYFNLAGVASPDQHFQKPVALTFESYIELFEGAAGERAIGEASTSYLRSPRAPGRIKRAVPDARLIAVLRNPVDRAFSRYSQLATQGVESQSFAEAVARELAPTVPGVAPPPARYVEPGFYGAQLDRYLGSFDRSQLSLHLYDDLARDPARVMAEIYEFLEVDASFVPTFRDHNVTRLPPRFPVVNDVVRRIPGKAVVAKVVPDVSWNRAKRAVRRWNSRTPEFPRDLRRQLVELYRDDIRRTQEIIGRDLSSWTVVT